MTSQYISVIEDQLDNKYPQHQQQQTLTLQNIRFKLFLPKTTLMLNQYQNLRTLNINHCDLRNLDNFPKIYTLEELDLGFNQIQGTFNNLMPLKKLKYLNLQHNLIFESNKLAPLRKIASAPHIAHQKNQTKVSICIRNNPFIQEDTPYLIKFKNYGLKVIKQPKEYFDKKKQDQQKTTKNKSSTKKGKKNQQSATKSNKKRRHNWYQQSSNEDSSLLSYQSPIIRPQMSNNSQSSNMNNNNNLANNNLINNNLSQNDRRPISHQERMQYLRVSRNNIIDNYSGQPGTMLVRMGSSRPDRGQILNLDENPFVGFDSMDEEDDINNLRGMFEFEDEDSDSDDIQEQEDRFGNTQGINNNNYEATIQQRIRLIERRNARLQQIRQIQRQSRLQRERMRLERRQLQRQSQLLRRRQIGRMSFQRRRQEREMLRRQQQRELLRQQERQLMRRLSSSSGSRNVFRNNHQALPNSLGSRLNSNASNSSNPIQSSIFAITGGMRRPIGYRESLQRRLLESQPNTDNINSNDPSNRSIGSLLPPLRVRASNDPNSNIIHLQRASSISNNPNQILFADNNNQPIRVYTHDDMDSYSDSDDNDQENIEDPDDDSNQDDGAHICDSNCEDDHLQGDQEQQDRQNQEPLRMQVQPLLEGDNNGIVDYQDSGIELFINDIVNGNIMGQNIDDSDQSQGQYDFVINDDGAGQMRRNNNQPSNLSFGAGNQQKESEMQHDEEEQSSD